MFDRYNQDSVKTETRTEEGDWQGFLSHPDGKAELLRFVSGESISSSPPDKKPAVAQGILNETPVPGNDPPTGAVNPEGCREQADTRTVLQYVTASSDTIMASA